MFYTLPCSIDANKNPNTTLFASASSARSSLLPRASVACDCDCCLFVSNVWLLGLSAVGIIDRLRRPLCKHFHVGNRPSRYCQILHRLAALSTRKCTLAAYRSTLPSYTNAEGPSLANRSKCKDACIHACAAQTCAQLGLGLGGSHGVT